MPTGEQDIPLESPPSPPALAIPRTLDAAMAMAPPPPPKLASTRLPAFPPHAVIKSSTPPSEPALGPSAVDAPPAGNDAEPIPEEGLRWKPRAKAGDEQTSKPVAVIRGKGDVKRHGWGHLPPQLMRLVLIHAIGGIPALPQFRAVWSNQQMSAEIVASLSRRSWLAEIRSVCASWRTAIDAHPFWWRLISLLSPTYDPIVADAASARLTLTSSRSGSAASAIKAVPTPFRRAVSVSRASCVPCRVSGPEDFVGWRVKDTIHIDNLGPVAVCEIHEDRSCASCLIAEWPEPGRRGEIREHGIYPSSEGEIDAFDNYRTDELMICRYCRGQALEAAIIQQLRSCARSGQIMRGDQINWTVFPEYQEYVVWGNETARFVAETLVTHWALTCQGRYRDLEVLARELQQREHLMRWNFYARRSVESTKEREERWGLLRRFDRHNGVDSRRDEDDRKRLLASWNLDWRTKDENSLMEEMREEEGKLTLNERVGSVCFSTGCADEQWSVKLQDVATNDILFERYNSGIWVLPSVEADVMSHLPRQAPKADQPLPRISTSPLNDLIASVAHPFPHHPARELIPKPTPFSLGIFRLETPLAITHEPILPPSILIQTMDERFMTYLRRQLLGPLRRLAADIVDVLGDEESAEKVCEGMGLKEVLEGLRGEAVWLKAGVLARRELQLAIEDAALEAQAEKPASPRVELVEEEREELPSVVQIIHEEPIVVVQPATNLGKRKSPPAELPNPPRPAPGSRESSVRPVSAGGNTSSSTPEDIVMPITPEEPLVETLGQIPVPPPTKAVSPEPKAESLESIAKMAVKMNGDAKQGAEMEVDLDDGDEESDLTESDSDGVGRGRDGHYEEGEDYEELDFEGDELEMDRRLREENAILDEEAEELMEVDDTKPINGPVKPTGKVFSGGRDYTSSTSSSSYEDESTSSSLLSSGPGGVFPKESDLITGGLRSIPFVPLPASDDPDDPVAKYLAKDVIMTAWWDVRKYLRVCRCTICERARKREEGVDGDILKLIK